MFVAATAFHGDLFRIIEQLVGVVGVSETGDIFAATWSIPIEFQFYLAFPFLTLLLAKYGSRQMLALIGFFLVLRIGLWFAGKDVNHLGYWSIAGRADQFIVGMLSARLYYQDRVKWLGGWGGFVSSICLIAVCTQYFHHIYGADYPWEQQPMLHWFSVVWPDVQAFMFGCLILSFLQLSIKIPTLIERPLLFVGTVSFSLYIMHRMVEHGLALALNWQLVQFTSHQKINALLTCTLVELPLALIVAWVAYYAVEKPFHEFKRDYRTWGDASHKEKTNSQS